MFEHLPCRTPSITKKRQAVEDVQKIRRSIGCRRRTKKYKEVSDVEDVQKYEEVSVVENVQTRIREHHKTMDVENEKSIELVRRPVACSTR
jgi:ribosomal protein L29